MIIMQKKMAYSLFFPDDFGLRSPFIQKPFQTKIANFQTKCAPSMVARVFWVPTRFTRKIACHTPSAEIPS